MKKSNHILSGSNEALEIARRKSKAQVEKRVSKDALRQQLKKPFDLLKLPKKVLLRSVSASLNSK